MSQIIRDRPYLANVWRLLFACTPGLRGWDTVDPRDEARYQRIFEWGISIRRDLDADLTSAQCAVENHLKFDDWVERMDRHEPAPA